MVKDLSLAKAFVTDIKVLSPRLMICHQDKGFVTMVKDFSLGKGFVTNIKDLSQ